MFMSVESLPKYFYSKKIRFRKDETHISRIYHYSVIIFIFSGILRFTENGKKIELHPGDYYIQREGLIQEGNEKCEEPEYFFIEFNGEFNNNSGIPIRGKFSIDSFKTLIDELREAENSVTATFYKKYSLFLRILDKLYKKNNIINSNSLAYKIANYIHENYKKDISVAEMEKIFSYSSNHIINVFKEQFSMTPHQYIKKLRLDEAKQLMINTNRSLEQIAFNCGYKNFSTFFRSFSDTLNISPSKWREDTKQLIANKIQNEIITAKREE